MESLFNLDLFFFTLINQTFSSPWLDPLFIAITFIGQYPWLLGLLWILLMLKGGKKGRQVGWMVIPLLLISDQLTDSVLKPLFERPRPFTTLEEARLLYETAETVSPTGFPSSHAVNIFALCTFLLSAYRIKSLYILLPVLAVLVSYSRIYVGVHYPSDVFAGGFIGIILGILAYWGGTKFPKSEIGKK